MPCPPKGMRPRSWRPVQMVSSRARSGTNFIPLTIFGIILSVTSTATPMVRRSGKPLAFTLDQVAVVMTTRKLRGRNLTHAVANRRLARCRMRIEHVDRRVTRCRSVPDADLLRKAVVRGCVMEVCGAVHSFRVRLTPWQPMVKPE
jgi:hypothetical protein